MHMGDGSKYKKYSKFLSLVLRHKPEAAGISLDAHGWARVFNTCKWNNMAETAELRLFLCQVYKNLMLYGVVFHVKQWYNGGYETLV